jgi:hypothetical protein
MSEQPFRKCGSCQQAWTDWRAFLLDPELRLLGLQVIPQIPDANLFVFEHECGSSVSVLATRLRPHLGPQHAVEVPILFGGDLCRQHCRLLEDLEACDRPCANARDRWITVRIEEIKRTGKLPEAEAPRRAAL